MNTIKTALSVLGDRLGDGRAFSLNGQGKRRFRVKPGSLVKDNGTIPVQVWSDEYQEWVAWQCVRPEVIFHGWGSCDPVIETNGHTPPTTAVENPTRVKPPIIEQKEPTTNRENEALLQLFGGRTKSEKEQPTMAKSDIPFIPPDEPDSAWDEEDVFPSDEPEEEEDSEEEEDEMDDDEDDEPSEDDMDDEPSEEELEELEAEASRLLKEASRAESGGKALPKRESVPTSPTASGKGILSNPTVIYQDWRPAVCWCTPNQILQVDMPTLGDIQYQVRGSTKPLLREAAERVEQSRQKVQQRTAPAVRTPAPTANGAVNSETGKKETMRLRVFKALARKPMTGKEIAKMLGLPNPPMFIKDEGVRDIARIKRQKFQDDRAVVFSLTEQGYKDLEAGKVDSNRAPVSTGIPWQQGR